MCMYELKTGKKGWGRDAKKKKFWCFIFQVT